MTSVDPSTVLGAALDALVEPVLITDAQGGLTFANATANNMAQSWVMWAPGQEIVAQNVAKDISAASGVQITHITAIDGATAPNATNNCIW